MKRVLTASVRTIYRPLALLLLILIKRLPGRFLIKLKQELVIIKKMDYGQHDIYLNISSNVENDVRLHSCKKEPETIEWIETFFQEGEVFYDIGANIGAYSLVASKFLQGKVKIYAFEPGFVTFPQLCKNVITNNCQESITPLQVALSEETAIGVFNYHNLTPGGAIHTLGDAVDYKGETFEPVLKQPVISYRIDDLVKNFGLPIPNHIKIDVDGIELSILRGAEETLENPAVSSLIVEIEEGNDESKKIMEFLSLKGFKLHSKHKYVFGGDSGPFSMVYNCILLRAT